MFYEACRHDGCSRRFAGILYSGVRFGTWMSHRKADGLIVPEESPEPSRTRFEELENDQHEFWDAIDSLESAIENEDLDAIDQRFQDEDIA